MRLHDVEYNACPPTPGAPLADPVDLAPPTPANPSDGTPGDPTPTGDNAPTPTDG